MFSGYDLRNDLRNRLRICAAIRSGSGCRSPLDCDRVPVGYMPGRVKESLTLLPPAKTKKELTYRAQKRNKKEPPRTGRFVSDSAILFSLDYAFRISRKRLIAASLYRKLSTCLPLVVMSWYHCPYSSVLIPYSLAMRPILLRDVPRI